MRLRKQLTLTIVALCLTTMSSLAAPPVKNVIFMIGDGMGLSQVYAAAVANGMKLTLFDAPYVGLSITYSANRFITDSAAGGTALATGTKTNNGMIGMNADSIPVQSIMALAKAHGYSTGVVATSPVTHATPASFYGHNITRKDQEGLAMDLLRSDIDFFVGGGKRFFEKRADSLNLSDSLRLKGYDVVYTLEELKASRAAKRGALLANVDMAPASEREMLLPIMTQEALNTLSANGNSFFLMVEGSQIDYQGHNNETDKLIAELLEFDQAVAVALQFMNNNPGTLLVVTADHETGGMLVLDGNLEEREVETYFNSDYHSGIPVPVFAFGSGAQHFSGVYQNTDFFTKFKQLLGF